MGLGFFGSIIIGGLAGWIASKIMEANTGLFLSIILGIVGALVLNGLLRVVGIYPESEVIPQLLVGFGGACLLIWLGRKFS